MLFLTIFLSIWILVWIIFVLGLLFRRHLLRKRGAHQHKLPRPPLLLSIFHPYCNSGGGGERVLWSGVKVLLQYRPNLLISIYTNDSDALSKPSRVFQRVRETFDIDVVYQERVHFVPLLSEPLLRPSLYPCLTLAGQALGSIVAGFEALVRAPCDVYLDTTGFSFTLPLFSWLLGARCGAYVHFPTISSDMQQRVAARSATYNNSKTIGSSKVLTALKSFYYALFRLLYGWTGSSVNCDLVAVNSSWTLKHIAALFGTRPFLLYPPCPCLFVKDVEKIKTERKPWIISIGQFRPEKNHIVSLCYINDFCDSF